MDGTRTDGFPVSAGLLLGLGLGGFFDGIVLHQMLQWRDMVTSAGFPPDSVENLKVNSFRDGVFHASAYVLTALGPSRGAPRAPGTCSGRAGSCPAPCWWGSGSSTSSRA